MTKHSSEYVSRPEPRLLVTSLEKLREIIPDLKGVKSAGQGCAGGLFRVFAKRCPDIRLRRKNVDTGIAAMFQHLDQTPGSLP